LAAEEAVPDVVVAVEPEALYIKPIRLQKLQPCQFRLVPVVPVELEFLEVMEQLEATPFL
tara:strand:- start:408 stop:587 length:180 start_codon:yes stop_codon:yes gene_type:complete